MAGNPYINRYKQDLQRQEQQRRSALAENSRSRLGTYLATGVGVAAAIHIAHPSGIVGALDDTSRYIRAYSEGFSKAFSSSATEDGFLRGIGSRISNAKSILDDIGDSISTGKATGAVDDFQSAMRKVLKGQEELHIDRYRREAGSMVKSFQSELRRSLSDNELYGRLGDFAQNNKGVEADDIRNLVENQRRRLANLTYESRGSLQTTLKEYGITNQGSVDQIWSIVQETKKDVTNKIKNMSITDDDFNKLLLDGLVQKQTPGNEGPIGKGLNFIRNNLQKALGYKQATGEDLLNLEGVDIRKETKDFLKRLQENHNADLKKFIPDSDILVHNGKLVGAHQARALGRNIRSGFSEGLLGHLTYQRDMQLFQHYAERPAVFLRAGHHQFTLNDLDVVDSDNILRETLVGVNGNLYKISDLNNPVKEGVSFASGRYASTHKFISRMSGINRPDWDREDAPFWESMLFDITNKREPGLWQKAKSWLTKNNDPNYLPNKVLGAKIDAYKARMFRNEGRTDIPGLNEGMLKEIKNYLNIQSPSFSDNVLKELAQQSSYSDIKGLEFDTVDDLVNAFSVLSGRVGKVNLDDSVYNAYSLLGSSNVAKRAGFLQSNEYKDGVENLRKGISDLLIQHHGGGKRYGANSIVDYLALLKEQDKISAGDFSGANKKIADFVMNREYTSFVERSSQSAMEELLTGNMFNTFDKALGDMLNVSHPRFGIGHIADFEDSLDTDIIPIKNMDITSAKDWKNVFFGGRHNMSEVNKGTLLTYGVLNRLNDLVREFDFLPLALSDESLGSPMGVVNNLMFKRVLPIYAGVEAVKWANDYWMNVSGFTLEQHEERAKAHTRLKLAKAKDATGLTNAFKWLDRVTPGSEGLEAFLSKPPITGPTMPLGVAGGAASWSGIFSSKSYEEWLDYYENGEDPVRKGRHWLLGTTAWMGGKIDHYEPNSYKQAMSQWKYTQTVYGTRDNYWAHNWLPSPSHPLSPVEHFITDRYWFEEMHRKDRPYELSGELFDPNSPWGMLLNPTVGQIIKPVKPYTRGATKADLQKQAEANQYEGNVITRHTGGDFQLELYVPKYGVNQNPPITTTEGNGIGPGAPGTGGTGESIPIDASNLSDQEISVLAAQRQAIDGDVGPQVRMGRDFTSSGLVVNGQNYSMQQLAQINKAIISKAGQIQEIDTGALDTGFVIPYYNKSSQGELSMDVQDPRSMGYRLERTMDIMSDVMGARGFLVNAGLGGEDYGEGKAIIESTDKAYATSNRFWSGTPGGYGGAISEVARRFVNKHPGLYKNVNRIPNMMPDWLPENFQTGDPYSSIKRGEIRLPGEAYESLNQLHPDEYGRYGAVDRAAILADVAPWSEEFKFWLEVAKSKNLTQEEKDFLKRAQEQNKKQREQYFLTPYQFIGQDVERKEVVVDEFIDENRFTVRGSNEIYRLAGVRTNMNPENEAGAATLQTLEQYMMPGTKVSMVTEEFEGKGSKAAVVYSDKTNVNQLLRKRGVDSKDEEGAIGTYVDLGPGGRAVGKVWETIAHAQVPFLHNKVMNVNSPREHYERVNVYGKEWQSWNEPVEDFIVPTYQSAAAQHPLGATVTGATAGFVAGLFLGGSGTRKALSLTGALAGGGMSVGRMAYEQSTGQAWIPERRLKERDIMNYYDMLTYLKNRRLFNKYADVAKAREGVDVEEIIARVEKIDEELKAKERRLEALADNLLVRGLKKKDSVKGYINSQGRLEYKLVTERDYIKNKRAELLKEVKAEKARELLIGLGPYAREAIKYRQKYKSTLYAIDEDSTHTQIMSALPKKDREYFKHFSQEKDPEKREEILKLVPENQKRAYKILWGMEHGDQESLRKAFEGYYLPDEDWVGWREGVDLEDSIIKLIENEGLDPKDFGLWRDYTEDEELTPAPTTEAKSYKNGLSPGMLQLRLNEVLTDYNISDLEIEIVPREGNEINVGIELIHDIRGHVSYGIQKVLGG